MDSVQDNRTESPSSTTNLTLLTLPLELRLNVLEYLLTPSNPNLTIRSLFIRKHYRNVYMTQQPKNVHTALLVVCKQLSDEALTVLYGCPRWRSACRMNELATQIGKANFGRIKKMEVDVDDLSVLVESLEAKAAGEEGQKNLGEAIKWLNFECLEILEVEGYQASALNPETGTTRARLEALKLCALAQKIMNLHPHLRVLLTAGDSGDGGGDALDLSLGRVKWKFVPDTRKKKPEERLVDLSAIVQRIQDLLGPDPSLQSSLATRWTKSGVYAQYPYLVGRPRDT